MSHDVFISHSSINKTTADAICHALEKNGIRCWIAPRDVPAGSDYAEQIMYGIQECSVFLLVFSDEVNNSTAVKNELERAVMRYKKTVVPFRIEDAPMSESIDFLLARTHWVDAYPSGNEFDNLVNEIAKILGIAIPEKSTSAKIPEEPASLPITEHMTPPQDEPQPMTDTKPHTQPKDKLTKKRESLAKHNIAKNCLSIGEGYIVGVKTDGTVVSTGKAFLTSFNVSFWRGITSIYMGGHGPLGIKADGTVILSGSYDHDGGKWNEVREWEGIIAIEGYSSDIYGLKSDGTVVSFGVNKDLASSVSDWRNIVAISADWNCAVGLKADGTVVAAGKGLIGRCNVDHLRDIVAVSTRNGTIVVLKSDGTVERIGGFRDAGNDHIASLRDIVAIATGKIFTVAALRADGTVIIIDGKKMTTYDNNGQRDIVSIVADDKLLLGLKSDGTVVVIAGKYPSKKCDISTWRDIGIGESRE
ncbi:MAG: TIR domain-containing protein [Defluviitaleaceae bacterium]|nr:TIR domain-containing protein [Defluviitaleaceae bacterium]